MLKLDEKECLHGLTQEERQQIEQVKSELDRLISLKEISWRHKSRATSSKEGDNNTKYFQKLANSHRKYNHLRVLEVGGVV